jgi:hypothetical protein
MPIGEIFLPYAQEAARRPLRSRRSCRAALMKTLLRLQSAASDLPTSAVSRFMLDLESGKFTVTVKNDQNSSSH